MTCPVILPLTDADITDAGRMYTDIFLNDEPLSKSLGMDPDTFSDFALQYAWFLAGKNLSFIARDEGTREPAGIIFCIDMAETAESAGEWAAQFLAPFRQATVLINELEDQYFDRTKLRRGEVLHIFQVGVDRNFRRQGIAGELVQRALENARGKKFREAAADCTSGRSRRVFERCGFRETGYTLYQDFTLEGQRFFAGLDGGITLMVRDI